MAEEISSRAAERDALLRSIEAVDYAPPTLGQVKKQLEGIREQLVGDDKQLKALEAATPVDDRKSQHCIVRRNTQNGSPSAIGPTNGSGQRSPIREILSAKEQKEEKEYLEAFAEEQKLRAEKRALGEQVESMENEIKSLSLLAREHTRLRNELMRLYETVFGGPTPNHPEEDQAEQAYTAAQESYDQIEAEITNESRAFALLQQADRTMQLAARSLAQAEDASTWDLAVLDMPQGNIMSDVLFDSVWTDVQFHKKIQAAIARSRKVHTDLRTVCGQSQAHLSALKTRGAEAETTLNRTRGHLERVRRGIMEGAGEQLPMYQPPADGPPPAFERVVRGNPFADALAGRVEA